MRWSRTAIRAAPAPVALTASDGTVKLGDLMKAKAQEGKHAKQVTQAGEILGDLRFMSPEQSTNASAGDGRADLYSLGATAYAVLTGRAPLEGKNYVETILKIRAVVVNGDLDNYMRYYKERYRSEHHLARYDEDTIERLNLAA